ncbi:MAG: thioredoxin family protein [Crocosphaera sp.]|nr:thioredoxin family protein [Crocosphaera sp.]
MATQAVFYHAGCPVCTDAQEQFVNALDPNQYDVEVIDLGREKSRLSQAEGAGVKSVPALVIEGKPFHINFGASLDALK